MTAERTQRIALLFTQHAATVQGLVRARVSACPALVEDACQTAWERLCMHPEVDPAQAGAVRWLVVTATREAWRRARNAHEELVGNWLGDAGEQELPEPAGLSSDPCELVLGRERHADRVALLAKLTSRERRYLALHGIGLSYVEIAATEGSTVRTVERQILRARRRLGLARRVPAADGSPAPLTHGLTARPAAIHAQ